MYVKNADINFYFINFYAISTKFLQLCSVEHSRKNWEMIDTVNGATSSAILYSIAETVKANNLKPFDYFEYLLTEIPKHTDDQNTDFFEKLLPWSQTLPEYIRKTKKAGD